MSSCRYAFYLYLFAITTVSSGIHIKYPELHSQYQGYGNIKSRPILNITDVVYKSAVRFLRCSAQPDNPFGITLLDPLVFDWNKLANRQTLRLNGAINGIVYNISQIKINYTTTILPSAYAMFRGNIPHLAISGWYNVSGTLAKVLPVFGSGSFSIDMYNVSLSLVTQLDVYENGSLYMTDFNIDFNPKSIQIALGDILGGGPLGSLVQDFLQDSVSQVLSRSRPQIQDSLKDTVVRSSNPQLLQFPGYRDFLLFLLRFGNSTSC